MHHQNYIIEVTQIYEGFNIKCSQIINLQHTQHYKAVRETLFLLQYISFAQPIHCMRLHKVALTSLFSMYSPGIKTKSGQV